MRFAKLINDYPSYAPRRMRIGSSIVYNPTDAQLLAEGYLPMTETEPPETDEQHYPVASWEERDGEIVQVWTVEELPEDIPDEEALDIILGGGSLET